jgi:uncharacterized protein YutE (UPF0331/DUF86 family)
MVNPEKVHRLLHSLEDALFQLRKIASMEWENYSKDSLAMGAAKYYLQTGIEACIDIGNHIISSEGYRPPKDYRDVFTILLENEIIPDEVAHLLGQMAGLRNRLVHLYWQIDEELIYKYMKSNLIDFDRYSQLILEFLKQSNES